MRRALCAAGALLLASGAAAQQPATPFARYQATADRLIDAALRDSSGYDRLGYLVDTFGPRLSGSASLEQTIDWVLGEMRKDGFENVRGEPVMVPHWVRGAESATLVSPRSAPLHMIGLGMSVGTPKGGITAPVLVVSDFDELTRRAAEAKGKIVLFDHPFPTDVPPFEGYSQAVRYRSLAPTAAAKVGAVAALIRSVSSFSIQNPHTGSTRYPDSTAAKIPAAALSVEDAMMLHRMQDRGQPVVVHLEMNAQQLPDAPSRNVVAELRGSERPDEVVLLSGHIDSWDVGQGAMDDADGAVAAWQAVRLMKQLGLRPRRTVRVVMWTNEENGARGGRTYRQQHDAELAKHQAVMESDNGTFRPNGFRFSGSDSALAVVKQIGRLLARIGATSVVAGEPETDVGPMVQAGVPGFGLDVDGSRYFWYHHSSGDMLNVISRQDFSQCVATMAVMAYVLADMPERLAR